MATTPVHVRIDADNLSKLEKIGEQAKPKPLNRSEMINVAVEDYVRRNAPRGKGGR